MGSISGGGQSPFCVFCLVCLCELHPNCTRTLSSSMRLAALDELAASEESSIYMNL